MLRIKSKYKIGKRLGPAVFEQCQTQKFALSQARSASTKKGGGRGGSDYGRQLLEKQRVRFTYGLTERKLSNYVQAAYVEANPSTTLHRFLETRLDNAAYRAGFVKTRRAARQLVSHGHVTVNGIRSTSPSHQLKKGDAIEVRHASRKSPLFSHLGSPEATSAGVPAWLTAEPALMKAVVTGDPSYAPGEAALDYKVVFEFYSR